MHVVIRTQSSDTQQVSTCARKVITVAPASERGLLGETITRHVLDWEPGNWHSHFSALSDGL